MDPNQPPKPLTPYDQYIQRLGSLHPSPRPNYIRRPSSPSLPTVNRFTALTQTIPHIQSPLASTAPTYKQASLGLPSSTPSPSPSSPSPIPLGHYYYKPNIYYSILILEPPYDPNQSPKDLATSLLNPLTFTLDNTAQTQFYFELILEDTQSIVFTTTYGDHLIPQFVKCKIQRILPPSEWGGNPSTHFRHFSADTLQSVSTEERMHLPTMYNYWDYKKAWYYTFYQQNPTHSLSYFFMFCTKFNYKFPKWFFEWWNTFGATIDIFPPEIHSCYDYFQHNFIQTPELIHVPPIAIFCGKFRLPWIFAFQFTLKITQNPQVTRLVRQAKIKWWKTLDLKTSSCTMEKIKAWFADQKQLPASDAEALALKKHQIKLQLLKQLDSASSEEELERTKQQFAQSMAGSSSPITDNKKEKKKKKKKAKAPSTSSSDQESFTQPNEDDCYGINFDDM